MGFFARRTDGPAGVSEQTVTARYALGAGPGGTATDLHSVYALEERLAAAIGDARAGEFEPPRFGADEVVLSAYGPDADRLFAAMEPALRSFPPRPATVLLRYGGHDDADAPEAVVRL